jgi:hypothetical protein
MFRAVLFVCVFVLMFERAAFACESCSLSRLGTQGKGIRQESKDKRWFTEYMFERQIWEDRDAAQAHALHHQGHHAHAKISEDIHHYTIGRHFSQRWTVSANLPFVVRRSKEVDSHAHLGEDQQSQGLGDMQLVGQYDVMNKEDQLAGILAGIKFPTGRTKELNDFGGQFEPELQPGSGSYDYLAGGIYQVRFDRLEAAMNMVYALRRPAAADFEFGDAFTSTGTLEYTLHVGKVWQLKPGVQINYQYETRQKLHDSRVDDSGGQTLLGGPQLAIHYGDGISVHGFYLSPLYQKLGGVHQELAGIWGGGAKLTW